MFKLVIRKYGLCFMQKSKHINICGICNGCLNVKMKKNKTIIWRYWSTRNIITREVNNNLLWWAIYVIIEKQHGNPHNELFFPTISNACIYNTKHINCNTKWRKTLVTQMQKHCKSESSFDSLFQTLKSQTIINT